MKFFDGLKTEKDAIQQQKVDANKNERVKSLKEVKHLASILKSSLVEGRKRQ